MNVGFPSVSCVFPFLWKQWVHEESLSELCHLAQRRPRRGGQLHLSSHESVDVCSEGQLGVGCA